MPRRSTSAGTPAATLALIAAALLAACTIHNPDYVMPGSSDASVGPDMSVAFHSGTCSGGARACTSTDPSCSGQTFTIDRLCPVGSTCRLGVCQSPTSVMGTTIGNKCDSEALCSATTASANVACTPFIESGRINFYCAPAVGSGASATACTKGENCRSGFCLPNLNTCFRACNGTDSDCPVGADGVQLRCKQVSLVDEGVPALVQSCVHP